MAMNYDQATALRIKAWLMNNGLTENGTYGLMANMYCESGFRANNLQNSGERKLGITDDEYVAMVDSGEYTNFVRDSHGFGICQWTFWSRKEALLNFARAMGASIGDETMQLEYLIQELSKKYPTVLNLLRTSDDERECAIRVMLDFERPANQSEKNQQKRADYATELRSALGNEDKMIRLALDAGHGYDTPGKRCSDENQTREWYLNDRVVDKLERKLLDYNCEVLRTDDSTGAVDVPKEDRADASNDFDADYFISVHHNAGANGTNAGGTVVYHYCNTDKGIRLAEELYQEVVAHTGLVGNRSSKVVKSGKYVLVNTNTYAYLIENGFMDSAIDLPIILTDEHAENTAEGILQFLIKNCGLTRKENVAEEVPETVPESEIAEEEIVEESVPVEYFPKLDSYRASLKDALKAVGVDDPDFEYCKKVANANDIKDYAALRLQDGIAMKWMRQGKLIKPE